MTIGKRYPKLLCAGFFIAGSYANAGNISIYSITGGAIDEGMTNITTGDNNISIGENALTCLLYTSPSPRD